MSQVAPTMMPAAATPMNTPDTPNSVPSAAHLAGIAARWRGRAARVLQVAVRGLRVCLQTDEHAERRDADATDDPRHHAWSVTGRLHDHDAGAIASTRGHVTGLHLDAQNAILLALGDEHVVLDDFSVGKLVAHVVLPRIDGHGGALELR